jgi:hypothetical protein
MCKLCRKENDDMPMNRELPLAEGYYIFYATCHEDAGAEVVAKLLTEKIRAAQVDWDMEFISNAKIDSDGGGTARSVYFGFQCVVLRKKLPLQPLAADKKVK